MLLFLAVSCQKETTDAPVFVEKTFFPTGEQDAKTRVTSFLEAVKASKSGERTAFLDTEVNEGRWTLEGAGNYEKNVNLGAGNESGVEVYSYTISNTVDNGVLKMEGISMTTKYATMLAEINAEESASGRLASAIDMNLVSVNTNATDVEVKVLYEKVENDCSPGMVIFPKGAKCVNLEIANTLQNLPPMSNGCFPFSPDIHISTTILDQCFGLVACMSEGLGPINNPDYNMANVPSDASTALSIANQYFTQYVASLPTPGPGQGTAGSLALHKVEVAVHQTEGPPIPNPYIQEGHYLYVGLVAAANYGYCY